MRVVDESAWEPDDETPGQVAMLVDSAPVQAGLWRTGGSRHGPFEVPLQMAETIYVLSGTGVLQVDDQPPIPLRVGVTHTIAAGSLTRWTVDADFTEVWIYH